MLPKIGALCFIISVVFTEKLAATTVGKVPVVFATESETPIPGQRCISYYNAQAVMPKRVSFTQVPEKLALVDASHILTECQMLNGSTNHVSPGGNSFVVEATSQLVKRSPNWLEPFEAVRDEVQSLPEKVGNGLDGIKQYVDSAGGEVVDDVSIAVDSVKSEGNEVAKTVNTGVEETKKELDRTISIIDNWWDSTWERVEKYWRLFLYTCEVIGGLVLLGVAIVAYMKLKKIYKFGKRVFTPEDKPSPSAPQQ